MALAYAECRGGGIAAIGLRAGPVRLAGDGQRAGERTSAAY